MSIKISLILPIRNEELFIENCLASIFNQIRIDGMDLEIIVADGMSNDSTRKIIKGLQQQNKNLIIIDNPGLIVSIGINKALEIASGEIIIRVDGHTTLAPDYVYNCVQVLLTSNADNVGGRMYAVGTNDFANAVAMATSTPFGVGGSRFHYSNHEEWVDSVYMGAWKREIFQKVGRFDEELVRNQDDEFNYRLRKRGGKILLSPIIKSKYLVRSNPKALYKQYYQYGFWKVRVLQKHPKQMSLRQFVPPLFVSSLIVSLMVALIFPSFWIIFGLLSGVYLLVDLGASVIIASRHGWRYLPLLPLVFPILHISYGLGFLVGLIKFADRWGGKAQINFLM
jgi:glycosyltransferase involved in cell wall biosynthesis